MPESTIRDIVSEHLKRVDAKLDDLKDEMHQLREEGHRRERKTERLLGANLESRLAAAEREVADLKVWRATIDGWNSRIEKCEDTAADQARETRLLKEARAHDRGWMAGIGLTGTVLGTLLGLGIAFAGLFGT